MCLVGWGLYRMNIISTTRQNIHIESTTSRLKVFCFVLVVFIIVVRGVLEA